MELRRLSILAVLVLAAIVGCTEGRHSVQRRSSDYEDDGMQGDMSSDYGAQNDADGGNDADDEEEVVPGRITSQRQDFRLPVGRTVRLVCDVEPKETTLVTWSKEDDRAKSEQLIIATNKVTTNSRISLESNTTNLVIRDLELSDTGSYKCTVLQKDGNSVTHTLVVQEFPTITRFTASENGRLHEGDSLLLTCDVTGSPKPSLLWSRQKKFGLGSNEALALTNGKFTENTFFKANVTKQDSGTYYCYALNDAGNATRSLVVSVTGKPRVEVHQPVINTDIDVEAVLQCSTHEEPIPEIRWYKDDRIIETVQSNGATSTLVVTPKQEEDFGTYSCEAFNEHGSHRKSISLVQSPVIDSFDAQGPKLTWNVHSHQPLEKIELQLRQIDGDDTEWRTIEVPVPPNKGHEHSLVYILDETALSGHKYEAIVKVKNEKAWSQNDPAVIELESQAQPIQTASVLGAPGNANSIRPSTFAFATTLMYLLVRMF